MKIILSEVAEEDLILGIRAAKWLLTRFQKDAIVSYEDEGKTKDFYVKRNKASITVRPCLCG